MRIAWSEGSTARSGPAPGRRRSPEAPGYRCPMVCPECATTNPDAARFCLSCGARLEESPRRARVPPRAVPAEGHARQARGRPGRPVHGGRAPDRHHALLRREGLDGHRREPRPGGVGRDHERGLRAPHRAGLPVRGNARPADGRRDLRVLRRADRPRGRPAARGRRRPGDRRGDPGLPGAGEGRARPGPERPRGHQHGSRRRRPGRVGPPARVHGDGRRGERRGPDGADGRARDRPDHGRDAPAGRPAVRRRVPRRDRGQGQGRAGRGVPRRGEEGPSGADARTSRRRRAARRARARARGALARRRRDGGGARSDGLAGRRGGSGQEPADRGDPESLGPAPARGRPRRRRHPPHLGGLAVRLLRHDPPLRAVPPDGRGDRRHRGHGSPGGRPGAPGPHDRGAGVARAAHARVALAVRRARAGRGGARGRGVPTRDHGARPARDPLLRRRSAAAGVRGPALVRRGLDGPADRDREARRRAPLPVPVRLPSRAAGAVVAAEAVARDRVPAPVHRDRALAAVAAGERRPDRPAAPGTRAIRCRPHADPRADGGQPAVRRGDGLGRARPGVRRRGGPRHPDHAAGVDHRAPRHARRGDPPHAAARLRHGTLVPGAGAPRRLGRRRRPRSPPRHPGARRAHRRDRPDARARVRLPPQPDPGGHVRDDPAARAARAPPAGRAGPRGALREPARGVRAAARAPLRGGRGRRADASLRDGGRRQRGPPLRQRRGRDALRERDRRRPAAGANGRDAPPSLREPRPRARARWGASTRRWPTTRSCGPPPRSRGTGPRCSTPTWRWPPCTRRRPRGSTPSGGASSRSGRSRSPGSSASASPSPRPCGTS